MNIGLQMWPTSFLRKGLVLHGSARAGGGWEDRAVDQLETRKAAFSKSGITDAPQNKGRKPV